MISVYVQKTLATAKSDTPLTSGSVGTAVQFYFSSDWDGLNRTAVFETSAHQKETAELGADNSAVIPESVMVQDGVTLFIGVYGTNGGGSIVVPTVYANCGEIKTGANTEPGGEPVTPSQAQQLQNQIDDLDNRVDALEAGGGGGSGGGAVTSVNGQTGAVVLNATDVGALPSNTQIPSVPSTLPNPNKLTFTGAVSAEYDGSAAVSVDIPEGGGGGGESEWKLINTITLTEAVREVTISEDSDGNPLSLKEVIVRQNVSCGASSNQKETVYVNNASVLGGMDIIKNTGYFAWSDIKLNVEAEKVKAMVVYSDYATPSAGSYNKNAGYSTADEVYHNISVLSADNINQIRFSCSDASQTFAIGSSFTIWGY